MANLEELLVEQYFAFAKAAATLIDLTFDSSAEKELRTLIRRGVKNMIGTRGSVNLTEVSKATETLLGLVLSIPKPKGQKIVGEGAITKGWEKRCPGCPPWC